MYIYIYVHVHVQKVWHLKMPNKIYAREKNWAHEASAQGMALGENCGAAMPYHLRKWYGVCRPAGLSTPPLMYMYTLWFTRLHAHEYVMMHDSHILLNVQVYVFSLQYNVSNVSPATSGGNHEGCQAFLIWTAGDDMWCSGHSDCVSHLIVQVEVSPCLYQHPQCG